MTKHKVADLNGPMLDAAVALADGKHPYNYTDKWCLIVAEGSEGITETVVYEPSLDWELGGPIIERERIGIAAGNGDGASNLGEQQTLPEGWCAAVRLTAYGAHDESGGFFDGERGGSGLSLGPTPLIAAMRAFVVAKLGPEVEL